MGIVDYLILIIGIGLIGFVIYLLSTVITGVSTDFFLMNPQNYKKNPELKDPFIVIICVGLVIYFLLVKI